MDKDLQQQAGESSHSQTLQDQMLLESNDSHDLDSPSKAGTESLQRTSSEIDGAELGEQLVNVETREIKLARALARVTLEGYNHMFWDMMDRPFLNCLKEFNSFKEEVFDAMAHFVWNLYDEEDFENIAFTEDIFNECERIWKLFDSKGNFELDSSLLDVSKYEKVREQDLCNILQWCNENKSHNNDEEKDFSNFEGQVPLHPKLWPIREIYVEEYVMKARDVMLSSDNLDPKGMVKEQLRRELYDLKCFCIMDALYMKSWKHINFQELESMTSEDELFESLISNIHRLFNKLAMTRIRRLRECESLVTYPLSGNIFGSWNSEVLEVVKQADLKRRSEGRRFIGTDHLAFCLNQRLVSESAAFKSEPEFLKTHVEEKHKDTVYHIYRKTYKIATALGHKTIGLEHLYVAITSAYDVESFWRFSVDCVRIAKAKREGKLKGEGKRHVQPWDVLVGKNDGKRVLEGVTLIECLKKIQDKRNTPFHTAISKILDESKHLMTEGEMINSSMTSLQENTPALRTPVFMYLAIVTCQLIHHIGSTFGYL